MENQQQTPCISSFTSLFARIGPPYTIEIDKEMIISFFVILLTLVLGLDLCLSNLSTCICVFRDPVNPFRRLTNEYLLTCTLILGSALSVWTCIRNISEPVGLHTFGRIITAYLCSCIFFLGLPVIVVLLLIYLSVFGIPVADELYGRLKMSLKLG